MGFWSRLFGKSEPPQVAEDTFAVDQSDLPEGSVTDRHVEPKIMVEVEEVGSEASSQQLPGQPEEASQEKVEETKEAISLSLTSHESPESVKVNESDESKNELSEPIKPINRLGGMPIPQFSNTGRKETAEDSEDANDEEPGHDGEGSQVFDHEHLEDLSVVDGHILPQLVVPDWREELEFVKGRYEPCDLTEHIVKVSKRRLTARRIDHELAKSRLNAYRRYLERASRRFKEKIDEDALLNNALRDLSEWRSQQSRSVAWKLAERINEELLKAKSAESEATAFVEKNNTFSNAKAVDVYRYFARRLVLIPLVTLYLSSVVSLTYDRFDWLLKFLPFFNLGINSTLIMISGVAAVFWLNNLWRYSKKVRDTQKNLLAFNDKYQDQYNKIKHAVREHTRLSLQQPHVEPILHVLAKAYRVQLHSDVSIKAHATTFFDPASLPACVTLARAVDNDEGKIARLKRQALRVLMSPGWRTNGLDEIARIHADSKLLDSNSLSLKSLDTDSVVSASNAQKVLLEAFSNVGIHDRVSKSRLIRAIRDLHFEVLAKWDSEDRPEVVSLRDDGFNKLSFKSSWLEDEDVSENWIDFLTQILIEDTAPFGAFNIHDKRSELSDQSKIRSVAVVPHYFNLEKSKVEVEKSPVKDVMPMDVVVRVDVSPWADPSAFAVFSEDVDGESAILGFEPPPTTIGGGTSA